ncbi:MAG: hypothetical protein ACRDKL_03665 [Solirubrobacteraceae bacterium]
MRALLGFVGLQGLLALSGVGLLRAMGLLSADVRSVLLGLGPAWLAGTAMVGLVLVQLLVVGVPFTLVTVAFVTIAVAVVALTLATRRGWRAADRAAGVRAAASPRAMRLVRVATAVAAGYAVFGAYALARAPTIEDDARIWSLKGLALSYHDSLRPEIFLNPWLHVDHSVYPLFQPVLEAVLSRAMGQPQLRLFHTELWLLLIGAIWTAGYLLWWRCARPLREQLGVALLALVALTPAAVSNISSGHADASGAVVLAIGALTLGLWIERGGNAHLWLAALLLGTAANIKDEDMVGAVGVFLAAGVVLLCGADRRRLWPWLAGSGLCAAVILPWRIWTGIHHLHDAVTPPLPRALTPGFLLGRTHELRRVGDALLTHSVSEWGWAVAIFAVVCVVCLAIKVSRRLTAFYLLSVLWIIVALAWIYGTTPVNLSLIIPRSLGRTVDVFMMLCAFASAHLLTALLTKRGGRTARAGAGDGR